MEQQQNSPSSNLAIQIVSIIGGLLAAICLIFFLALTDIVRSESALSIVGICSIVAAIVGNRIINQLFLDTSITAFYVAGCVALCFALARSHWNVQLICLIFILIAVLTFLFSKGVFFPFLSVLIFNVALTWLFMESVKKIETSQVVVLLMGATFLALSFFEARCVGSMPAMKRLFRPLHTGFFLSSACGLVWLSGIGYTFDKTVGILSPFIWIGIVLMLRHVMRVMEVKKTRTKVSVYAVCFVMLLPTIFAPSLSGALLLLLICFSYGYKAEMVVSLLLFMYMIVKYYYDLQLTLLAKSGILFFTGIALLIIWYFFTKHTTRHEEI